MKSKHLLHCLLVLFAVCFICTTAQADTTYVKFGSQWKYLAIGSAAPTGAGAADWRNIAFNDASWNSGPAELGYGDGKERTTVSYGGNPSSKYITTYFRQVVNIADISLYGGIRLNTYIDDGAVIYVNGTEVARTNISGTPVYSTLATTAAENGNSIIKFDITSAAFVSGDNIIAVELHQSSASSTDLTFDLELIARPGGGGAIFNFGSSWKYLDNGTNQGTAWIATAFNDASWKTGNGRFGYGDAYNTAVFSGCGTSNYPAAENGAPGSCGPKYITTYFRKVFSVTGLSNYTSFTFSVYRDDGIAIYVNGVEVARDLLSAGASYTTTATNATDDGQAINTYSVPASYFLEGSNTVAVEIHQTNNTSTDLTFDMQLVGNVAGGTEPDIIRGPLMQMLNSNAVSIRWTTTAATTSRLKYGASENSLTSTLSDNTVVTEHEIRITGLTPDTKYFYAVGSASSIVKGSYRNYFTTAPPANATRKIRIGVFGDPGKGDANQKSTRNAYLDLKNGYNNSELAIMLGDNAYDAGTQTEHQTHFFDIYDDNIFTNHVVMPVPGNHEYANDGSAPASNLRYNHNIPYYSVFSLPTAGESGGVPSGTEQYYAADYGNIHFIMLDTYGYTADPSDPSNLAKFTRIFDDTTNGPQAKWLKQDLAANAGTHKWTIVCMHHPPYTNGTHASNSESDLIAIRQMITPILERYGVDIVLAGHSHVYERSFLVKDHTGLSTPFNTGAAGAGTQLSSSSARYDGSAGNASSADFNAATTSCPYFTIDSVYKHGTVYVVAGSAGQIGGAANSIFPVWYYKNYSGSTGGEVGALYLEIEDNRLDAKFVGGGGTVHDQFTIMKGVNKKTVVNTTINTPTTLTASWIGGYNWYTTPFPPITSQGTARTLAITPAAAGNFTYYVNDSLAPKTTCMADTFMLQVTSALAVSVINYNAFLKNKKAFVQWTTTQEINSDYFTIERSANGRDYELIMVMAGKDNSSTPTNYEFIDNDPLPGISYYRLIATDKNGDKKIAGIKSINNIAFKQLAITIQPNPAVNNEVYTVIQSAKKQTVKIKVYSTGGAEVYSNQLQVQAGATKLHFHLAAGAYIVNAETQDGTKLIEKVLVN